MKDDIRSEFEAALAQYNQRADAQHKSALTKEAEKKDFGKAWAEAVETIIRPALEEVDREILTPAGWICDIGPPLGGGDAIAFQVKRGDLRSKGYIRPLLFIANSSTKLVEIRGITASQGTSNAIELSKLSSDLVQELALDFFKRISAAAS